MKVFVLVLVIATALVTIVSHGCVPVSQRMAAPVLCPAGTAESVVVAYTTNIGGNKTSAHSHLYCIDGDGGGYQPARVPTIAVQAVFSLVAVLVVMLAVRTVRRRKATPAKGDA